MPTLPYFKSIPQYADTNPELQSGILANLQNSPDLLKNPQLLQAIMQLSNPKRLRGTFINDQSQADANLYNSVAASVPAVPQIFRGVRNEGSPTSLSESPQDSIVSGLINNQIAKVPGITGAFGPQRMLDDTVQTRNLVSDPMQAIKTLYGNPEFNSLPLPMQQKVLQVRGGTRAVELFASLQNDAAQNEASVRALQQKALGDKYDASQTSRKILQGMYEKGDLVLHPEQGLLQKQKDAAGQDQLVPANPFYQDLARQYNASLGLPEIPQNPAQKLAKDISGQHPELSQAQVSAMVKQQMSAPRVEGLPSNIQAAMAANQLAQNANLKSPITGIGGGRELVNKVTGMFPSQQGITDFTSQTVGPKIGSSLNNLFAMLQSLGAGVTNAGRTVLGMPQSGDLPYGKMKSSAQVYQEGIPSWAVDTQLPPDFNPTEGF